MTTMRCRSAPTPRVLATTLKAGESAEYAPGKARNLYLVPAVGSVEGQRRIRQRP